MNPDPQRTPSTQSSAPISPPAAPAAAATSTTTITSQPKRNSSIISPADAIDTYGGAHSLRTPQITPQPSEQRTKPRRPAEQLNKGRLSFVAVAREKTTNFLGDLSLREKGSLPQLSGKSSRGFAGEQQPSTRERSASTAFSQESGDSFSSAVTSFSDGDPSLSGHTSRTTASIVARPSVDHTAADGRRLQEATLSGNQQSTEHASKMHQTSSRLLRMTNDDRPFTKDFKDLFATLIVSLPLTTHRVRFQRVDHSFTSEEAINNLGSLKFSQSNRMPDPKDPSRIVTTTTTTTFSMAKEMARAVCQRFLEARFIEPADGKMIANFPLKGPVWHLTPKGITLLQRFCQRNGIQQRHIVDLIESPRNTMTLVILERDVNSDRLSHDINTIQVIFRRFAGAQPNIRSIGPGSDGEPQEEIYNGQTGVRQAKERRVGEKVVRSTFTGKGATDWLMDCTTIIDRRETYELADLFVKNGLMEAVVEDRQYMQQNPGAIKFQPTRSALYQFTREGRQLAGWEHREDGRAEGSKSANGGSVSATNNNRLLTIVDEPSLRLLFREYLISTHCEENLSFYLEVREFTDNYDQANRGKLLTQNDAIRENLAAAYGLYNAFLAPGSPNELNIDHNLRNGLAGRMTKAVGDEESMLKSLQEVVDLFKDAQNSVFKLMSSDSVPKFLKDPKFAQQLKEYKFDQLVEQRRGESPTGQSIRQA